MKVKNRPQPKALNGHPPKRYEPRIRRKILGQAHVERQAEVVILSMLLIGAFVVAALFLFGVL